MHSSILKSGIAIVALAGIVVLTTSAFSTAKSEPGKGFAVVELFTSEGCSSCPPADELVAKIQKENPDRPVYVLAYHVDYWNRLGWKDAFSSSQYSDRQRQYATWLQASVYTPQAVVNGSKEFVGSEEKILRSSIKNELLKTSSAELVLNNVNKKGREVNVDYLLRGTSSNTSLALALVEKNAETKVLKGENRGRTLSHVQIVRNLQTINLKGKNSGSETLDIPEGLANQPLEIIAFLQNNNTGEIIAASKSSINN